MLRYFHNRSVSRAREMQQVLGSTWPACLDDMMAYLTLSFLEEAWNSQVRTAQQQRDIHSEKQPLGWMGSPFTDRRAEAWRGERLTGHTVSKLQS